MKAVLPKSLYFLSLFLVCVITTGCGGGGSNATTSTNQTSEITVLPGREICAFATRNTVTLTVSAALGNNYLGLPSTGCSLAGESIRFNLDGSAQYTYPDGVTVSFSTAEVQQAFQPSGVTEDGVNVQFVLYRDGLLTAPGVTQTLVILSAVPAEGRSSRGTYFLTP